MIASNQRYWFGVAHFKSEEQEESLHWVETTVDEISHEEIVGQRAVIADSEQLHQIVELTVNVATYLITKGIREG